ncbi:acetyl-CoA synthetase [Marmoricola sp. URHA0025 HA25]
MERFGSRDVQAAEVLCDGHDPARVAFTAVGPDLTGRDVSFGELSDRSRRLASVLSARGVVAGDRVAVLMGKTELLPVVLLAIWRLGAVHVPLFTAFAAPAVELRVRRSGASVAVVGADQREKIAQISDLDVVVAEELATLIPNAAPWTQAGPFGGETELVRLFTSGTTGDPKAVSIPVRALASFCSYLHFGLDLREDDVFWNAADPGWAYGLYYGILGPLAAGRSNLLLNAPFSPALTAEVIRRFGVTNFAAAPTVYRALRAEPTAQSLSVRVASSAGEPLTPDVPTWTSRAWGVEVRDHYGQTEQGMVIANGWHSDVLTDPEPGSMGRALPGFTVDVIEGAIAIDMEQSPLAWFRGYFGDPDRTAERVTDDGRWYLTGDVGSIDDRGNVFFRSRDDDVILMAGYRIGPFEVESVLVTHPAVAEAAVVGAPDELRGEVLVAFVVLEAGDEPSDDLTTDLQTVVKTRYAAHAYPRTIHYVDALPKTPSGKVQRFELRNRTSPTNQSPTDP